MVASVSRGYNTIETYFKNGFKQAFYVKDCLPARLKTPVKAQQLCLVHVIRELTNFKDTLKCTWGIAMRILLQEVIYLKHQLIKEDYQKVQPAAIDLEKKTYKFIRK